jgi:hypothetical protein
MLKEWKRFYHPHRGLAAMEQSTYHVISIHPNEDGGFEATIGGPGIPTGGVRYWFVTEDEPDSFVENLNLSYITSRELAACRRGRLEV